jgi:hypothetical protein
MSAAATSGGRLKWNYTGYKSTKSGGAQRGCVALCAAMSGYWLETTVSCHVLALYLFVTHYLETALRVVSWVVAAFSALHSAVHLRSIFRIRGEAEGRCERSDIGNPGTGTPAREPRRGNRVWLNAGDRPARITQSKSFAPSGPAPASQNFSTHGRSSISQVQALRSCCSRCR